LSNYCFGATVFEGFTTGVVDITGAVVPTFTRLSGLITLPRDGAAVVEGATPLGCNWVFSVLPFPPWLMLVDGAGEVVVGLGASLTCEAFLVAFVAGTELWACAKHTIPNMKVLRAINFFMVYYVYYFDNYNLKIHLFIVLAYGQ
jgi:hypothetical protein